MRPFFFVIKIENFSHYFHPFIFILLIYTFKQNKNEVNKMPIGYNANQVNLSQPSQNTQPFSSQIVNQNVQPLFPQPTGNVYNINSTLEVANVPVGAGISVALCLPENVMYIKTMQNGNPLFYPYKIMPFTNENQNQSINLETSTEDIPISVLEEQIEKCNSKIGLLEEKIKLLVKQKGGL